MRSDVPRQVFLFSGHIVDAVDRREPRFPAELEGAAGAEIAAEIDRWAGGPGDLALCGGAAGGDLIFATVCLSRGLRLEVLLPFAEERFMASSVDPSGETWSRRFRQLRQHAAAVVRELPTSTVDSAASPYIALNRELLARALEWGSDRLVVIALWDGRPGDGAGGTADMVAAASEQTNHVRIIDPAELTSSG